MWLDRLVWGQVVGPAKSDRLIPKFRLRLEGSGSPANVDDVACPAPLAGKVRIARGVADDFDVSARSLFIEAVRQQAVVFQISNCGQQAGGHMAVLIAKDRLEDLHLLRICDLPVVGFVAGWVRIIVIANNTK